MVGRGLAGLIRRGLKIDDAGVARSRVRLTADFDEVAARLADGRRYLTGDAFTAADLTFAALAAPVVWPDAYAAFVGPLVETPKAMQALVAEWRATVGGEFVLRMYAEHRGGAGAAVTAR
ncbi:MAG: glutathione S-transferase C-terminal domain-containing protein [Kofleriaceae bacterium]